jgi:poly-beta-1,6-N-acetyl-D-glucosamine synthase
VTPPALLASFLYWTLLACLVHLLLAYGIFFGLLAFALVESRMRARERRAEDFETLSRSRFTIPVSVIGPVYNEEPIVVSSVRSLLAQQYPEAEVITVNDGSSDGTLRRLQEAFDLEPRQVFFRRTFPTKEIRAIYRSRTDPRLIVVDKANGGKADALNCGLNLARYRYVCCVDGDTVFEPDALLRGMRLAVKDPANVVGVTSHVAIADRPEEEQAERGERRVDRKVLTNFQAMDYLRAFLNNRTAWTRLDFMLCSVGAFAIWRRDVLMELGGFADNFTCEDIEMTFRVHERYLREGRRCRVLALPDTVGRTEGPDRLSRLISQRARWQRVIMETVWHYRHMLLNPRFRTVGLIGMPYYVVSEVLAPIFEVLSLAALPLAAWLGVLSVSQALLFAAFIAFVNGLFTSAAVLLHDLDERSYRLRDLARLIALGPAELFLYRPPLSWARIKGTWGFLRGDKGWHKFGRNGRPATS